MHIAKTIGSVLLALSLAVGIAAPSLAAEGYRGTKVNGCQAYISGSQAWTNCSNAKKTGSIATKAWCTGQPTRQSNWNRVSEGSTATGISLVGCTVNVHSGQTLWQ